MKCTGDVHVEAILREQHLKRNLHLTNWYLPAPAYCIHSHLWCFHAKILEVCVERGRRRGTDVLMAICDLSWVPIIFTCSGVLPCVTFSILVQNCLQYLFRITEISLPMLWNTLYILGLDRNAFVSLLFLMRTWLYLHTMDRKNNDIRSSKRMFISGMALSIQTHLMSTRRTEETHWIF